MVKWFNIACGNLGIFTEIKERIKERIRFAAFTPTGTQIMNQGKKGPFGEIRIHQEIIISIKKP
jgi:hypothetical protein